MEKSAIKEVVIKYFKNLFMDYSNSGFYYKLAEPILYDSTREI